jgi:CubicO group peptidase (beta-lactamase class C family)
MRPLHYILGVLLFTTLNSIGQIHTHFADSIREKYKIPELAYAVISSDKTIELEVLGFHKVNSNSKAQTNDKFRIGSNTKTITSYVAAVLVKQGKINYDTKFFDLYPELKGKSNSAYYDLTLQDLLTFRAKLISWTYTNETPTEKEIKSDEKKQRYEFVSWALKQSPDTATKITYWSNPSYVAAGLMLEKVTGKDYKTLVYELGKDLNIEFGFGQPNNIDKNQPWGHDADLEPEEPSQNYKLNWLSSAGNINVSLPDYAKFIQMQLQGLLGKSKLFTAEEFSYMHYGLPKFSFGWQVYIDVQTNLKYSYHKGNPGTFLSQVFICKDTDRAYIFFVNVQSDEAEKGLAVLFDELKKNQVK